MKLILKSAVNLLTSKPARQLYRSIAFTALIVALEEFVPTEILQELTKRS